MSDINDNIEQLFQDRFDGFESNVDPSVWEAVQSKLPQAGGAAPGAGMAQTGGKIIFGQFKTSTVVTLTSIAASLLVAFGIYQYLNNNETPAQQQEELVEQERIPNQQNDQIEPVQEELIISNNEDQNIDRQPEVVQNDPKANQGIPPKNEENEPEPGISPNPSNNQFAKDEHNVQDPKIEESIPPEQLPDDPEQLVDNGTVEGPEHGSEDPKIEITTPPEIEEIFAGIQIEKIVGEPYSFKFKNSGQGSRYEWDLGDGSYAIVDDPKHTFDRPGEYNVRLTVYAQDGRAMTDEMKVNVYEASVLTLPPNALSPNGDHLNDTYDVEGKNMQKVSITVMDFTGALVFTSDSFEKDWDGNDNNGRPLPPGQYPVVIKALGFDSIAHTQKIFVSLYR